MRGVLALTAFAGAAALSACGGDTPDAESTVTTKPPAATVAVVATETTSPSGAAKVESVLYPYRLVLPDDAEFRHFRPATTAWDGVGAITRDGPYVDVVTLGDGQLYMVALENPGDLPSFVNTFADNVIHHHACSEPANTREESVAGVRATLFSQLCEQATTQVRVAMVHEGVGLIAFLPTTASEEAVVADRLVELLSGLEWTSN